MSEAIATFSWSANSAGTGINPVPVTVPAGVTTDHLAIMAFTFNASTDKTWAATDWTTLAAATLTGASGVTFSGGVLYRVGGMTEGQVINFVPTPASDFQTIAIAWFDSPGLDVTGAITNRPGSQATSSAAAVTSTAGGPVVIVGWEKSSGVDTVPPTLSQGTVDKWEEGDFATGTVSTLIGSFNKVGAGTTGATTITYPTASTRGAAITISLDPVVTAEPGPDGETLQAALQRLSGTDLDAQGAANAWAGTTGLDLLGALNTKAGNARGSWLGLLGVLNQLAGTTGLDQDAAARAITA